MRTTACASTGIAVQLLKARSSRIRENKIKEGHFVRQSTEEIKRFFTEYAAASPDPSLMIAVSVVVGLTAYLVRQLLVFTFRH